MSPWFSRIAAVSVTFCLMLSDVDGLAQAAALPRFARTDFSSALFCREAVPAPLQWMHRAQGMGLALRRMAAAAISVTLAGPAALSAGRAPIAVTGSLLPGRAPQKTFEEAVKFAREQGGRDVQTPDQIYRTEGLFGNLKIWLEGPDGREALKGLSSRPADANVLAFYENLLIQIQMETKSISVKYRLGDEQIELLKDPRVRVLMQEQSTVAYVVLPARPNAPGGLFRVSGAFKGDDPSFIVTPLATINESAPMASITLKSLLLPILLLMAPTLRAAGVNPLIDDPIQSFKEFWNMLLSGEVLLRAQPHVDVISLLGWKPITLVLIAAAVWVMQRFYPYFDRNTSPSRPLTFPRVVRQVLVVALFVLVSGTTLKAFGPNESLDSLVSPGSFMFLAAA